MFHYYIIILTLNHCLLLRYYIDDRYFSFFWRYISFFWCFSIKSYIFCFTFNCLWTILRWNLWDFHDFNGNFITNHIRKCFSCFCDCSLEAVLSASTADYLAWSRCFWLYLLLKFTYIFSKKQESIVIYKYSVSWLKILQIWKYENS